MINIATNFIFDNRPEPLSGGVIASMQAGILLESHWVSGKLPIDPLPQIFQDIVSKLHELFNLPSDMRILLTSSYFESISSAIKGIVWGIEEGRDEIAIVCGDQGGFAEAAVWCDRLGFKIVHLPLKSDGLPDFNVWNRLITSKTAIVAVASLTPEMHVKRDYHEIGAICRRVGAIFIMDFTEQSSGELLDFKAGCVDVLSIDGKAWGCPAGIGIMGIRDGIRYAPLIAGDFLQEGLRSGRFSLSLLAGMQAALDEHPDLITRRKLTIEKLYDVALLELSHRLPSVKIPVTANNLKSGMLFFVPNIEGEALVLALEMKGLFATTGSSCSGTAGKPSQTLIEMGYSAREISGAIYLTFREDHTEEIIVLAMSMIEDVVRNLWRMAGYAG